MAVYASDTSRALDELTKRMESLEKAVRSRLMSRSGTNSSVAGYLTAPESPSEEEEDFQDVGEESRYILFSSWWYFLYDFILRAPWFGGSVGDVSL